jgi:hypothetical protein
VDWLIKRFNDRYFNKAFYSSNPSDPFTLVQEDNRIIEDSYLDDVVDFFISTDVHSRLGLSVLDVMTSFDLPTYVALKNRMQKFAELKNKVQEDADREIQKRKQQLKDNM